MSKRVKKALSSWENLHEVVMKMTEEELEKALEIEKNRESPRKQHLIVMHRRLTRLKTIREREALLGPIGS